MSGSASAVAGDFDPTRYRRNVGIMLLNADRRVFVAQRIDTPGAWQMPQGGIDEGETPRQAALRELEEEIGTAKATIVAKSKDWLRYELPVDLRAKLWGGRYDGQLQKWFAAEFTGRDSDIDLATAHPEFDAWRWVAAAELPHLIVPFKRPIYEAVLKEFAALVSER
jgi:putative (di)nucleoside polyphosphate hydrolase